MARKYSDEEVYQFLGSAATYDLVKYMLIELLDKRIRDQAMDQGISLDMVDVHSLLASTAIAISGVMFYLSENRKRVEASVIQFIYK